MQTKTKTLPDRWTPLRPHAMQHAYWRSASRFNCVSAGRRGGKSELAKRKLVMRAMRYTQATNGRFIYCLPTRDQAKRIAWEDLKALVPLNWYAREPLESELRIDLLNGAHIQVVGMDRPERVEGDPIDGAVVDEYGDMKERAWTGSLRPALSTLGRFGWCDFIGKPRGRNHWYHACQRAMRDDMLDWSHFTWKSVDIIGEEEVDAAKRDIDIATFMQEYEGVFLEPTGKAYHEFDEAQNVCKLEYVQDVPLDFSFDFNVEPGIAVVSQEYGNATNVIDEVHIPTNSNTKRVAEELVRRWRLHAQPVYLFGDATGGARGTSQVVGSDWDIIKDVFRIACERGDARWPAIKSRVPRANGPVVERINAVNSRLHTAAGTRHLFVDPKCVHLIRDLNEVVRDGSGDIDKRSDPTITHLSDALGYRLVARLSRSKHAIRRQAI